MANSNRRSNGIDRLKVGDEIIEDKGLIKGEILSFYQQLYTENENWRPTTRFDDVATITGEEKVWLERTFTEEEVISVIKECAPDKAPGPDGYTMAFYQKSWEIIKEDIMGALQHFHQNDQMARSCNTSFIALIPKKKERLKRVIGKLVSGHQNAFIKTRQITDVALIANEALDWRQKSGKPRLLFKLDIEKAFDQLNWSYLFNILRKMGFGAGWIRWIKFCVTTVKCSVLVNGGPIGSSPHRKD
uniref:Uncharacterized protein LOC104237360 n=1 Tax=Nicotiana sylvestris TaxID=4096 RepID=A0A1U7XFZ4_NICSY|nr:PREDICTED: uncharacterized protein LOC104237360 [Nicotiana sylvestris]